MLEIEHSEIITHVIRLEVTNAQALLEAGVNLEIESSRGAIIFGTILKTPVRVEVIRKKLAIELEIDGNRGLESLETNELLELPDKGVMGNVAEGTSRDANTRLTGVHVGSVTLPRSRVDGDNTVHLDTRTKVGHGLIERTGGIVHGIPLTRLTESERSARGRVNDVGRKRCEPTVPLVGLHEREKSNIGVAKIGRGERPLHDASGSRNSSGNGNRLVMSNVLDNLVMELSIEVESPGTEPGHARGRSAASILGLTEPNGLVLGGVNGAILFADVSKTVVTVHASQSGKRRVVEVIGLHATRRNGELAKVPVENTL